MKAVRLHGYHQQPVVEDVPEPVVEHPLDVVVKIGGAGVCRTDLLIIEGQWDAAMPAARIIVVDRNPDALKLAEQLGADQTVVADGKQVDTVLQLTDGAGAHVVLDFVAEQGAEQDGFAMTGRAGSYFVIGYGGQ